MINRYKYFIITLILLLAAVINSKAVKAQVNTPQDGELPADFPPITIDQINNPSSGYIFMNSISFQSGTVNYNIILDSAGKVFYYYKPPTGGVDFKMQPNGLFSYGSPIKMGDKYQAGPILVQNVMVVENILDSSFNLIDQVQMKNNYLADIHEFQILPNGNYILISYEKNPVDMSKVINGGNPNANVIGTVIQELDENKNCVFQWRSLDYIPILDTKDNPLSANFEHVHGNSVFLDTDGNLIVSFPTTFEVVKIDMISGKLLWRFGGDHNEFEISGENEANKPYYFSMQHDVRKLPNGNLTMYDNGVRKKPWYSRAAEYSFDETNKKASLVWEYRHDPDISAFAMGSVQRLKNGNTLIDWGLIFAGLYRTMTEATPDKQTVFEMSIPSDAYSYRAFKYDLPACRPVADVDLYEAKEGNTYKYDNDDSETGVVVYFDKLEAFTYNYTNMKKTECAPLYPEFEKEAPVVLPYRFIFSGKLFNSFEGEIRFDVSSLNGIDNPEKMKVYVRAVPDSGVFKELVTTYDPTEKQIVAQTTDFGEYILGFDRTATEIFPPALMRPFDNKQLINNTPAELVWSSTGRYDSFRLQVADDAGFNNIIIDSADINTPIITLSGLDPDQTYYWRARTMYRDLISDWSDTRSFTFGNPFLEITYPNGGETLVKDSIQYVIRWNTNLDDSVSISLFKNGAEYAIIKDTLYSYTNAFAWKVPVTVPEGTDYAVQVRSLKDNNLIAVSNNNFTIRGKITDVDDRSTDYTSNTDELMISPNPGTDYVHISFVLSERDNIRMTINDQLGNEIRTVINTTLEEGNYSFDLNTSNLPSGLYYCVMNNKKGIITGKFLIVK